jgi:flagellar motor switch protein FliN
MSSSVTKPASAAKSEEPKTTNGAAPRMGSDLLRGIRVSLEARLGEAAMTVDDMMALGAGSIVTLETGLADHVDLFLNDTLVARGEIVAVGEKFGVRIVDIVQKS